SHTTAISLQAPRGCERVLRPFVIACGTVIIHLHAPSQDADGASRANEEGPARCRPWVGVTSPVTLSPGVDCLLSACRAPQQSHTQRFAEVVTRALLTGARSWSSFVGGRIGYGACGLHA